MKPVVMKIKSLSASERKITAEIIDCIREIDLLKIHLELGYPSLMEFLVRECGYSETAALRRIDAARIVNLIPEIRADLKNGSLNLSQVSILAQCVRQKEKLGEKVSLDKKKDLVNAVKHKRTFEVQKIAAQMLELPVLHSEKVRAQADESVRIEMSLTKSEMETLQKARELLGHIKPGMSIKELMVLMAERIIKAKDPGREVHVRAKNGSLGYRPDRGSKSSGSASEVNTKKTSFAKKGKPPENFRAETQGNTVALPKITASVKRQVFQRDLGCQWVHPNSGKKCGSRHLLEIDHKVSRWAGGSSALENLELKCRAHNQWKYREEAGIKVRIPLIRTSI